MQQLIDCVKPNLKNSKESQKSHVCPMWRCVLSSNFNYLGPEQNTMSGMSLKNFLSDFSLMITPLVIKGSLHSEIRSCVQTSITRRKKTSCLHSNKQVMNLAGDAPFSHFMAFKSPESRSIWMISSRRNFLIKGKENMSWGWLKNTKLVTHVVRVVRLTFGYI